MKKILSLLLISALVFSLSACGTTAEEGTTATAEEVTESLPAAETIATGLAGKLKFNDEIELNENNEKTLATYGIDETDVIDEARYVGSGATAEEIAVFLCVDDTAVEKVKSAVADRIQYLHDGYSDYGPDQVPEIDSAFVNTYGKYVVFVICADPDDVASAVESLI